MRTLTILATLAGAATLTAQGVSNYGTGCGAIGNASFYEVFSATTGFDLGNSTIRMTPNWFGGYDVTLGSSTYVTPTSPNLALGDDELSGPLALGGPFPYQGRFTTAVYMSSNGFLNLEDGGNAGCCAGIPSILVANPARIAPFWSDLNPASLAISASTHFEIIGACAYFTWVDVPEFAESVGNTFQICLQPTGIIEMTFQSMSQPATHDFLTGFSPGNGALDPGPIDLSASLPGQISTSPDLQNLTLTVPSTGCPPFVGTNLDLVTTQVPLNSWFTATGLSLQQFNPGLPLTGAPGCEQYIGGGVAYILSGSPTASVTFAIPNAAVYAGIVVGAQSACLVPTANPFGVITSNGVEITLTAMPPAQLTEDFEGTLTGIGNYPTGWTDGGGTALWSSNSGGTPSGATGPSAAFSGTQYMYCETSGSNISATFVMNSPILPNNGLSVLDMQLSRIGGTTGTLEVRIGDGTGSFPTVLATFTGPNPTAEWVQELLCFSATTVNVQFQFHYTAGGNFTGDLAIDDIIVR